MIEKGGETLLVECGSADGQRKSKKTRRGKKKKVRYDDEPSTPDEFENCEPVSNNNNNNNNNNIRLDTEPYKIPEKTKLVREQDNRQKKSCILRPIKVPQAPKNSTQFIIDDHEDCNLYFSFENQEESEASPEDLYPTVSHLDGFHDIDYEYESPDDVDNAAFYEQDFENIYRRAREDELLSVPKEVIMEQYVELEQRVVELENQLARKDPALMIMKLQEQLLQLQDENLLLKKRNASLLGLPVDSAEMERSLEEEVEEDDDEIREDITDIENIESNSPRSIDDIG